MKPPPSRSPGLTLLEGVAAALPDDLDALKALADQYTEEGFFAEGLAVDLDLARRLPNDPLVQYNLACSLSLTGDLEGALAALKKAVKSGYSDFKHLMGDKDLAPLRKAAAFRKWLGETMA
jgi:tetratricopeptide (TPR) repeat protein